MGYIQIPSARRLLNSHLKAWPVIQVMVSDKFDIGLFEHTRPFHSQHLFSSEFK
jgi:hypothetical protein